MRQQSGRSRAAGVIGKRDDDAATDDAAVLEVVGTNRHVIQGMHDVADERWDATRHALAARATNLDGRAYAVTVAIPAALRVIECKSDSACTVSSLSSGHARLEWPTGTRGELSWELSFRSQATTRGPRRP